MGPLHHEDSVVDDATSSMGESTYDFMDDRSTIATDDGSQVDMTDSLVSLSRSGDETDESASRSTILPQFNLLDHVEEKIDGSITSDYEAHAHNNAHDATPIKFSEPEVKGLESKERFHVSQTLSQVPGSRLGEGPKTISIHQSLRARTIPLRRSPFRILYWGDDEQKDAILHKIATALAVSDASREAHASDPGPSKFGIFPIPSITQGEAPQVFLIDSSGITLELEEVRSVSSHPENRMNGLLEITLQSGLTVNSSRRGNTYKHSENWILPDIAILGISCEEDPHQVRERGTLRTYLDRHGIPSLSITEEPLLEDSPDLTSIYHALPHLCFQQEILDQPRATLLRRAPVDLQRFLRLDAGQLNRSLACVFEPEKAGYFKPQLYENLVLLRKYVSDRLTGQIPHTWLAKLQSLVLVLLVVAASVAVASFATSTISPISGDNYLSQEPGAPAEESSPISTRVSEPIRTTQSLSPKISTTEAESNRFKHTPSDSPTQVGKFSISQDLGLISAQRLGDRHIVVKVPQSLANTRPAPVVQFSLSRGNSAVEYSISHLSDHVYTVQVSDQEAHGPLSLNVWTTSQPKLNKSIQVNFSVQWYSANAWARAGHTNLKWVKTNLPRIFQYYHGERGGGTFFYPSKQAGWDVMQLIHVQVNKRIDHFGHSLDEGRLILSRKFSSCRQSIHDTITPVVVSRVATIKVWGRQRTETICKGTYDSDCQHFLKSCGATIREGQKLALKGWWRLRGLD